MKKVKLFLLVLLSSTMFFSCKPDPDPEPEPDPDPDTPSYVFEDYRNKYCGVYEDKYYQYDNNGQPIEFIDNYLITVNEDVPGVMHVVKTNIEDGNYYEDDLVVGVNGKIIRRLNGCTPAMTVFQDYQNGGSLPELPYCCLSFTQGRFDMPTSGFTASYRQSMISSDTTLMQAVIKTYKGCKRAAAPDQPDPPMSDPDYRDAWQGKYLCSLNDELDVSGGADFSDYEFEICAYKFLTEEMLIMTEKTSGGDMYGIDKPNYRIVINSEGKSTETWNEDNQNIAPYYPWVYFRNDSIFCSYYRPSAMGMICEVTYSGPKVAE